VARRAVADTSVLIAQAEVRELGHYDSYRVTGERLTEEERRRAELDRRNRRARAETIRRDARKGLGRNLEEGAALIALGFELQGKARKPG